MIAEENTIFRLRIIAYMYTKQAHTSLHFILTFLWI